MAGEKRPSVEDTIEYCAKHYDKLLRRLADMGPLTVGRIRSEHQLCSATNGACPFCLLLDRIEFLETTLEYIAKSPGEDCSEMAAKAIGPDDAHPLKAEEQADGR